MLTTLKEVFRPTWKKITWTLAVAIPLTALGIISFIGIRHGPDYAATLAAILLLPYSLLLGLNIGPATVRIALFIPLQLAYFYIWVCFISFSLSNLFLRRK